MEELKASNAELLTNNQKLKEKLAELSSANSYLQNLLAASGIGSIFLDGNLRIKQYTPEVRDYFNLNSSDLNRPFDQITHRLGNKSLIEEAKTVLANKQPIELEIKSTDKKWFLVRLVPYQTENGTNEGLILTFLNITERKLAEESLRAHEQLLRHLTHNLPGGSLNVFDRNFRYLFAEGEGLKQVGLSTEKLVGKTLAEIFSAKQVEYVIPYYQRAFAGESLNFELEVVDQWYVIYTAPLKDADGNITSIIALAQNITERKRADKALRESEERLRLLVESIEDYAIITLTPDNRISSWNPGAESIIGYCENEVIGQPGAIIFTPEDIENGEHEKEINTAIENGRAMDERWHLRKDGSRFFASGVLTVLGDTAENGFVKILRDLTERKQMEETLREGDRRKDEFIATLAHELRNPLAPIRTGLEIMRRADDREKGQHAREIIERQIEQIVHLVDDLMDISRITQGKIKLKKEHIKIENSINSALETVQPFVEGLRHRLDVRMPDSAVYINADPVRLTQIVQNLLHNSAKYTEPGGHILLIAAREENEAVIRIRDNGIGIANDMLPEIFDMFAQTERGAKRGQGGLGIGLSLVRKLVEMHGGKVEANSDGEGKGSEFIVRLPLSVDQTADEITVKPDLPIKEKKNTKRRIQVVDDNFDAAEMLKTLLEFQGHEIRTAHTGGEAINLAAEFEPEAVLLDIGLPDIDGFEVAKRLRSQFPDLLLIALSGWGQEEDRRRSVEAGFNHHLVKPVEIETVISLLRES